MTGAISAKSYRDRSMLRDINIIISTDLLELLVLL